MRPRCDCRKKCCYVGRTVGKAVDTFACRASTRRVNKHRVIRRVAQCKEVFTVIIHDRDIIQSERTRVMPKRVGYHRLHCSYRRGLAGDMEGVDAESGGKIRDRGTVIYKRCVKSGEGVACALLFRQPGREYEILALQCLGKLFLCLPATLYLDECHVETGYLACEFQP